jgi:hypothetical protein
MKKQPFGKRTFQTAPSRMVIKPVLSGCESNSERANPLRRQDSDSNTANVLSLEDELSEWKRKRRHNYRPPWRQISFMASACFGIGYFVLPDSVNEAVQWLLLGLMIASFASGFSSRHKSTKDATPRKEYP